MKTDNRIKLLIVSEVLTGGGAERFVSNLLTHIDREVFEPILCLLKNEITYPLPNDIPVLCLDHNSDQTLKQTALKLSDFINDYQINQILTNIPYTMRYVAEALRLNGKPVCWIARLGNNPAIRYKGLKQWYVNYKFSKDAKLVNQFVCNASQMKAALLKSYPSLTGRVTNLANPTDFDLIDSLVNSNTVDLPQNSKKVILFVGRLHKVKKIDDLFVAFSILKDSGFQLWICGEGGEKTRLVELANKLNINNQIKWLGFIDNPYYIMSKADLFVLTSESEGLPNSLIEAQGLGLPAVSTNCPYGPVDIVVDGVTGYLVPVGDVDAISARIKEILNNTDLQLTMSTQAKIISRQNFSLGPLMVKWNDLLKNAFNNYYS